MAVRAGGAAVFSPPDARKCQVIFDVYTQDLSDPARGVLRRPEDLQVLRVGHYMVGLRPGKELKLAICIAGVRPDWRAVMGHYVNSYPELFEPVPAARRYEGCHGITTPGGGGERALRTLQARGVTCLEVHGHFPEYGIYITPAALRNPKLTWRCRPHPGATLSLESNRRFIDEALRALSWEGFGKHLLKQMELMIEAYPRAPGFFVDNFAQ